MRTRATALVAFAAVVLAACSAIPSARGYGSGTPSAAVKAFAEADTLFVRGDYEEAVRAWADVIRTWPACAIADDAYLRIAHAHMNRPDPARGWPGWNAARWSVARDTLVGLTRRYPGSNHTLEARNWVRILDAAIRLEGEHASAADSVDALLDAREGIGRSLSRKDAEVIALQRQVSRLERSRDRLEAENGRLAERVDALENEKTQIRAEAERMRRMLIDLEQRSGR